MKNWIFVLFSIFVVARSAVAIEYDTSQNFSTDLYFDTDVTIDSGVVINAQNVYVVAGIDIFNFGTLNATNIIWNMDNQYAVSVQNSGTINGTVSGGNINVTQTIHGVDDLRPIGTLNNDSNLDANFYLQVSGADMLNASDIIALGANADEIYISDSNIIVGTDIVQTGVHIVIDSDVVLVISDFYDDMDTPLLTNVEHGSGVRLDYSGIDPVYAAEAYWLNNNLYVRFARQTSYASMFENGKGVFLDELRERDSDDKLIAALDSAPNRNAMNKILAKSVRMNPSMMMQPVRVNNNFLVMDGLTDDKRSVGVMPFYTGGKDFYMMGASGRFSFGINDNLHASVGAIGGMVKYDGKFDDYSGALYGGTLGLLYKTDKWFAHMDGVLSIVSFDDVYAFDKHKQRGQENPTGIAGNFAIDAGPTVMAFESVKLNPFFGMDAEYINVLDDTEFNFNARVGIMAKTDTVVDGNTYGVGADAFVKTDGTFFAGVFSDFLSDADGFNGKISAGVMHDSDLGLAYRLSIDLRLLF